MKERKETDLRWDMYFGGETIVRLTDTSNGDTVQVSGRGPLLSLKARARALLNEPSLKLKDN